MAIEDLPYRFMNTQSLHPTQLIFRVHFIINLMRARLAEYKNNSSRDVWRMTPMTKFIKAFEGFNFLNSRNSYPNIKRDFVNFFKGFSHSDWHIICKHFIISRGELCNGTFPFLTPSITINNSGKLLICTTASYKRPSH